MNSSDICTKSKLRLLLLLQVAAELQSADELVLSELVFDGTFTDANAEQVVALLASVVWREHGAEDNGASKLPEDLKPVLKALHAAAHRVAKVTVFWLACIWLKCCSGYLAMLWLRSLLLLQYAAPDWGGSSHCCKVPGRS